MDYNLSINAFCGNHVQPNSFKDISGIADLCNTIKQETSQASYALQLYTQGGKGPVKYYQDKIVDYASDRVGQPDNGSATIADLQFVDEFKPDFRPDLVNSHPRLAG